MLAPRKKLWSSPDVAVDAAVRLLRPLPTDVVYDIGCGDGRFLVTCALLCGCKCIGIEIDEAHFDTACRRIDAVLADIAAPPKPARKVKR